MTTADFEHKTAPADHHYPQKIQAIIRTPGNQHVVSRGELEAARLAGEKPQPPKIRLCAMECGYPADKDDIYCSDCRSELTCLYRGGHPEPLPLSSQRSTWSLYRPAEV
jgi:hypothetical protein